MNSPIFSLPNELIAAVVELVSIVDAYQLSLTCRQFRDILQSTSFCRSILEKQAPFSPECTELRASGQYVRAFCHLAKRRLALSTLQPFSAAVVATVDSYLYVNGTLLYIVGRTLHILHLRGTVREERVVDIRTLLNEAVPESVGTQNYKFSLLHYADGVVSCRYAHCWTTTENWLVVFHLHENWAVSTPVPLPRKLFARNSASHVIFGSYSGQRDDGHRRWVLWTYSIRDRRVVGPSHYLEDLFGADMGETICFEIFDGYFYALSNQSSQEFTGKPNSYYYCCRFPLDNMDDFQVAGKASLWRRMHSEGTIDDRWTFLRLERSEETGGIVVVESRKEWRFESGDSLRSYYSQELAFPESCRAASGKGVAEYDTEDGASDSDSDDSDDSDDEDDGGYAVVASGPAGQPSGTVQRPHHYRSHEHVHPGDDSAKKIHLPYSSNFVRCYFLASQTFVDLVNVSASSDPRSRTLQLHAGSRMQGSPPQGRQGNPGKRAPASNALYPWEDLERFYDTREMAWPPPGPNREDHLLDDLLNPPGFTGAVSGTWDDRSLIYTVARGTPGPPGAESDCALILVSFDPSLYLNPAKGGLGVQTARQTHYQPVRQPDRQPDSQANSKLQAKGNYPVPKDSKSVWLSANREPAFMSIYHANQPFSR